MPVCELCPHTCAILPLCTALRGVVQAVKRPEAEALARDYGMQYFETSAKKGLGVEEAFRSIAESVVDRLSKEGGPVAGAGAGGAAARPGAAGQVDLSSSAGKKEGGGCCK